MERDDPVHVSLGEVAWLEYHGAEAERMRAIMADRPDLQGADLVEEFDRLYPPDGSGPRIERMRMKR